MVSIRNLFRRSRSKAPRNYGRRIPVYGQLPDDGADIGEVEPMTIAVVHRCVMSIADRVSCLAVCYESKDRAGVWLPEYDTNLYGLLNVQPNEWQSAVDFWSQVVRQLLIHGDVCVLPERGAGDAIERMLILSPGAAVYNSSTGLYDVSDDFWGIYASYPESSLLHFRRSPFGGVQGSGFMTYAYNAVRTSAAGEKENYDRFRNGGNVRGFITNEPLQAGGYNPHADKFLKEQAREKDEFFREGGRITYMGGSARFQQLMLSSADMQFLESRKFNLLDICRFFGVPPTFAFIDTSSNYKSAENANTDFLNSTLNPLLRQLEVELQRKLIPRERWEWRRFRFDRSGVFECDPETKVKWQSSRIAAGLDTLNEARIRDGSKPIKGGDVALMSANLKTLEALKAENGTSNNKDTDRNHQDEQ